MTEPQPAPGEFPYTRGIYRDMYRSRLWTMRQYAGFGTAEESNQRYKYLLSQGITGLSVAFDLPAGADLLASSPACPHQAFAIGRHLAMQFHVELDAAKLALWSASTDPGYLSMQSTCATVQAGPAMRAQAAEALPRQQALAARLYRRWLATP